MSESTPDATGSAVFLERLDLLRELIAAAPPAADRPAADAPVNWENWGDWGSFANWFKFDDSA